MKIIGTLISQYLIELFKVYENCNKIFALIMCKKINRILSTDKIVSKIASKWTSMTSDVYDIRNRRTLWPTNAFVRHICMTLRHFRMRACSSPTFERASHFGGSGFQNMPHIFVRIVTSSREVPCFRQRKQRDSKEKSGWRRNLALGLPVGTSQTDLTDEIRFARSPPVWIRLRE